MDVKRAFRKLSLNHHPDKETSDNKPYHRIIEAYERILEDKRLSENFENYKNNSRDDQSIQWPSSFVYT